jgi:membrane fusion protein (multidrug efflux system)
LQIPLDAVSRLEDTQYIYVIREGKARRVNVEIGARSGNLVEITKGLADREQIVVAGKDLVHDGTPVQIQPLPQS